MGGTNDGIGDASKGSPVRDGGDRAYHRAGTSATNNHEIHMEICGEGDDLGGRASLLEMGYGHGPPGAPYLFHLPLEQLPGLLLGVIGGSLGR